MAEITQIAWCNSTFNPWIGCTKVSVGAHGACEHCYAEVATPTRSMRIRWGQGEPRYRTSQATWNLPLRWERNAVAFMAKHGHRQRVFCASLADVFDNEVDPAWRADLFRLIRATPSLDWLLLTKRIGLATKLIDQALTDGHLRTSRGPCWPWPNVWIGASVVTQDEFNRDMPKLAKVPAAVRFLSIEPQMEFIDIGSWGAWLDWIINGGESRQAGKCRPYNVEWARLLRQQCEAQSVPFFMKQLGHLAYSPYMTLQYTGKGEDPSEWPEEIRVREFPR